MIEKAIRAVGLRQSLGTLNAGKLALIANHVSRSGDSGAPEQVVLSVDHSRSGLNTVLFCDDEGIIDALRQVYSSNLGTENDPTEHWKAVKTALEKFVQPPFGHSPMGRKLPDHIDKLVLYGDMLSNKEFLEILGDVLGTDLVEKAQVFDPVFASAVGMAQASHERMDNIDFSVKPAMGCRWRSKLYDERREEL
jgi:glycerol kinase